MGQSARCHTAHPTSNKPGRCPPKTLLARSPTGGGPYKPPPHPPSFNPSRFLPQDSSLPTPFPTIPSLDFPPSAITGPIPYHSPPSPIVCANYPPQGSIAKVPLRHSAGFRNSRRCWNHEAVWFQPQGRFAQKELSSQIRGGLHSHRWGSRRGPN